MPKADIFEILYTARLFALKLFQENESRIIIKFLCGYFVVAKARLSPLAKCDGKAIILYFKRPNIFITMKFQIKRIIPIKLLSTLLISFIISGCAISERNLAESSNPAYLTPFHNEWGVQLFIDEIDGEAVKYGELDRLALDGGSHDIGVRMEYQPAAGSSLVVGSLGNLLLRGATNKTFEFDITVELVEGHNNGLTVKSTDDGFELLVFDETAGGVVILEQQFKYEDGEFVRLF